MTRPRDYSSLSSHHHSFWAIYLPALKAQSCPKWNCFTATLAARMNCYCSSWTAVVLNLIDMGFAVPICSSCGLAFYLTASGFAPGYFSRFVEFTFLQLLVWLRRSIIERILLNSIFSQCFLAFALIVAFRYLVGDRPSHTNSVCSFLWTPSNYLSRSPCLWDHFRSWFLGTTPWIAVWSAYLFVYPLAGSFMIETGFCLLSTLGGYCHLFSNISWLEFLPILCRYPFENSMYHHTWYFHLMSSNLL